MTIQEWKSLSDNAKEKLISEVFNSSFLAATHFGLNPETDSIIQYVLQVTTIMGDTAHITIQKVVRLI